MKITHEFTDEDIQLLLHNNIPLLSEIQDPCTIIDCAQCPFECEPEKLYNLVMTKGISIELKKKEVE